jgi:hypothetical protein
VLTAFCIGLLVSMDRELAKSQGIEASKHQGIDGNKIPEQSIEMNELGAVAIAAAAP